MRREGGAWTTVWCARSERFASTPRPIPSTFAKLYMRAHLQARASCCLTCCRQDGCMASMASMATPALQVRRPSDAK